MENNKQDLGRWVDERLASLDGFGDWQPNAARAFSVLRWRQRVRRAGWVSATAATLAAGLVLLAISGPKACANPVECANEAAQGPAPQKAPAARNFKESGSPTATVTLEVYSDYECPSCAMAYASTIPEFVAAYVKTGKVKLLHRDFPLPQHQFARVAARYANAAGRLGYYDTAVDQIFKTQAKWEKDGSIDKQLMLVLPPGVMQQVRAAVQSDAAALDQSILADMTMGGKDLINQTPSVVIVAKGKRQVIAGVPQMTFLTSYVDSLLK